MNQSEDQKWMRLALEEAMLAYKKDEIPIGAVIVHQGKVIGKGHNQTESLKDATAHAEILAIGSASDFLKSWRLENCSIYVTVEPCIMCAGAIVLSRIKRLVFGAYDMKNGACGSLYDIVSDKRLNHQAELTSGVLERECVEIVQNFFKKLRGKDGQSK
ncbi:MAG TPA: tRNA adenosine(34) deaminase TadA [candidate division Zixibacteria bacterium]